MLACKRLGFLKFFVNEFCFMMKKDNFKQKLLLWFQVPFEFLNNFQFLNNFFQNSTKTLNITENSYLTNNANEVLGPVDRAIFKYKNHRVF